jgi:hypothetical protein
MTQAFHEGAPIMDKITQPLDCTVFELRISFSCEARK